MDGHFPHLSEESMDAYLTAFQVVVLLAVAGLAIVTLPWSAKELQESADSWRELAVRVRRLFR